MSVYWPTSVLPVTGLLLDSHNPRLGRGDALSQDEIMQYLFDHDNAGDIAMSIATRGFFSNEPLLAVKEGKVTVVVEGNRRLAALKALLHPEHLTGKSKKTVDKAIARLQTRNGAAALRSVPVTMAPDRKSTDKVLAGRHAGPQLIPWIVSVRANWILRKLDEGYTPTVLEHDMGFDANELKDAKRTNAIDRTIRALDLPADVREKLDDPRMRFYSAIDRVVKSSAGRDALHIKLDPDHGFVGQTDPKEFMKGFTRLVTDIARGDADTRTLGTNDQVKAYFDSIGADRPKKKKGTFTPEDFENEKQGRQRSAAVASKPVVRSRAVDDRVVPKAFKNVKGAERLSVIKKELTDLRRKNFPNAGSVLLRVFLELSVMDYLRRTNRLDPLIAKLAGGPGNKLKHGMPYFGQTIPELLRIAKANLSASELRRVESALADDPSRPFSVHTMHGFVHMVDEFPNDQEIKTFWHRIEPLMRILLVEEGTSP